MSPLSLTRRIALSLMHPNQVARPFHRDGWIYEEKVDGYCMAAVKTDDHVSLISRNEVHHAKRFPELVKALAALEPEDFILDGEVAVYDQALISRFEWLRRRPKDEPSTLPVYMVFDVLELDGLDLRGEPLRERRRVLEGLVAGERMILPVQRLASNGLEAWGAAVKAGYEGIVAKDPESKYVPGRTLRWIKVKQKARRRGDAAAAMSQSDSYTKRWRSTLYIRKEATKAQGLTARGSNKEDSHATGSCDDD